MQNTRMQLFLILMLGLNLINGHLDFQNQRYDALGLTPEKLALWNIWAVPVSFCTAGLLGTSIWPAHRLRSLYLGLVILNFVSIWHLGACQAAKSEMLEAGSLYWAFVGMQLVRKLVSDSIFVIEVAIINSFAAVHPLIAGSMISVLASASNFFGSLPEQWMPMSIDCLGLEWTIVAHTALGLVAVLLLVPCIGSGISMPADVNGYWGY